MSANPTAGDRQRQEAVITLVENTVEEKMQARESFTALDISNLLKTRRYPVRHGEVAQTVRALYAAGAMRAHRYDRRLIDVATDGGTKRAQAYLYLPEEADEYDYDRYDQEALPPVPADDARDLLDTVAAGNSLSPFASAILAGGSNSSGVSGSNRFSVSGGITPRSSRSPRGHRRDGALPIPRSLVAQAGWNVGDTLAIQADTSGQGFTLSIYATVRAAGGGVLARVWADLRVRICKTKLQTVAASSPALLTDPAQARVELVSNAIRVAPPAQPPS